MAAENENQEVIELIWRLWTKGGQRDKNCKDNFNRTPVHNASSEGHIPILDYLIQHGCDKEPLDRDIFYPYLASRHNVNIGKCYQTFLYDIAAFLRGFW